MLTMPHPASDFNPGHRGRAGDGGATKKPPLAQEPWDHRKSGRASWIGHEPTLKRSFPPCADPFKPLLRGLPQAPLCRDLLKPPLCRRYAVPPCAASPLTRGAAAPLRWTLAPLRVGNVAGKGLRKWNGGSIGSDQWVKVKTSTGATRETLESDAGVTLRLCV